MADEPVFAARGERVFIDPWARILRPELITIGDDVRIDAGVILSASHPIVIGDHVHIAAGSKIFASGGAVRFADFSGLSADVKIYTATDDYTGGSLANATIPEAFKDLDTGPVTLTSHALVGAGSVILPGVTLGFGCSVGALSLVREDVADGAVVAGVPARRVATRDLDRLRANEAAFRAAER